MRRKLLLVISLLITLFGCNNKPEIKDVSVEIEPKFGGVYIHSTIDEFCDLGFEYGDSVDVEFSNGVKFIDIPFYDGYYTKMGEPLLVAYPGYPYIDVCFNNKYRLYEKEGIDNSMSASISLNTPGKYLSTQQSLKMVYTNDRQDYSSDEEFGNFRCMNDGDIKPNILFRSASPCDNSYNRATYVDNLIQQHQINTIIDLADNEDEINDYYSDSSLDCPYWKSLYENNSVFVLDMSADFSSNAYMNKVKQIMNIIIDNDGPYLIHCTEGKDRTGFVCALIESLMNYSYDQILNDYMVTYDNYYGYNKQTNIEKYNTIVDAKFVDIINHISNNKSPNEGAIDYLISAGLTQSEIDTLIDKLKK